MHYLSTVFLSFLCLCLAEAVFALATDREQPIQIEADKATIDNNKGLAIYEGNVIVTQGSIRINAHTVTLNYNEGKQIEKVIATGTPARFKQTPEGGKEDIKAKAQRMEYNAGLNVLHLTQEAELRQAQDSFEGQHIMYDTQRGVIKADKGSSEQGRIKVTIQPRQ